MSAVRQREQRRRAAMIAVILMLIGSVPTPGLAYRVKRTPAGDPVHWNQDEVIVRLDDSLGALGPQDRIEAAIIEAFTTWERSGYLPVRMRFESVDDGEPGYSLTGDNTNDVVAITSDWPYGEDETAVTVVTYDPTTGELIDADILFNASRLWSCSNSPRADAVDLQDTATHEVGHFLGLDHSEVREAAMYPESALGATARRTLASDDLEALRAAYGPPQALGRVPVEGCAVAGRPEPPPAPIILAAVAMLLARRGKPSAVGNARSRKSSSKRAGDPKRDHRR